MASRDHHGSQATAPASRGASIPPLRACRLSVSASCSRGSATPRELTNPRSCRVCVLYAGLRYSSNTPCALAPPRRPCVDSSFLPMLDSCCFRCRGWTASRRGVLSLWPLMISLGSLYSSAYRLASLSWARSAYSRCTPPRRWLLSCCTLLEAVVGLLPRLYRSETAAAVIGFLCAGRTERAVACDIRAALCEWSASAFVDQLFRLPRALGCRRPVRRDVRL